MVEIQGMTEGPSRHLYKLLQDQWPSIYHGVNKFEKLVKFDWERPEVSPGTLLYELALETKEFCKTALVRGVFQRGDYRYLTELTAFFLGVKVDNFTFHQPGAHHQARFMADSLYLLVMQMTQKHIQGLSSSDINRLSLATDYISCYHTLFFLKSPHAAQAPNNDLRGINIAIKLMTDPLYVGKYGKIGQALYQSHQRHKWYLAPQCVPFAIVDSNLDVEARSAILEKLLTFDQPLLTEFDKGKPTTVAEITPFTKLEDLVSEQSYLFFCHLGLTKTDISLWNLIEFEHGTVNGNYDKFKSAVNNLSVVNDSAERHIRLVQVITISIQMHLPLPSKNEVGLF